MIVSSSRATNGAVVVVGSINVDQVVSVARHPQPGETLIGRSLHLLPGGKGANQAVAAAQLGGKVSMVGAVGSDGQGPAATSILASSGVDLTSVATVEGPSGLALITVADDGENSIVVVPGANAAVDGHFVETHRELISNASVVVLQGEIPRSGIAAAARLTTGRVVLNLAPVMELDEVTLLSADPLVVNEHEGALLLKMLRPGLALPGSDDGVAAALYSWGMNSVVLTRGAKGAICVDATGHVSLTAPVVEATDSSGAGDAFVGALSVKLAAGEPLLEASRYATRVGAFAVQGRGTQPSYPHLGDVLPEVAL